ncbi:MAG: helix-turn-helix domain-containing protein [Anaerolineae bacterium]|nr:helix-turn-helix domain-containing protein [Anaerolineae bacterium]MDQ7033402.1 helix-turn-helix domain-containing protein [Anaerolineae bacterium]
MMSDRINRKDLIVEVASELFLQQGYEATSIRQIADEVGVTEAALYYHFKEGKRQLLQAVFACQMPNFKQVLEDCHGSQSLAELIQRYGQAVALIAPHTAPRLRWLISEYPNFAQDAKDFIHKKQVAFHDELADLIEPFVVDAATADALAWTLNCVTVGHSQLFDSLELQAIVDMPLKTLMDTLGKRLD